MMVTKAPQGAEKDKSMTRSNKKREATEQETAAKWYKIRQAVGASLTREANELRFITEREKLLEAAAELFKRTQADVMEIRQAIKFKFHHFDWDVVGERLADGDLATSLAEDIAGVMRENTCDPQSVWKALSGALPDVHFTIDWYYAVAMVAAMLREARQLGVINGLSLADQADASPT
jgi:hypothetical protein